MNVHHSKRIFVMGSFVILISFLVSICVGSDQNQLPVVISRGVNINQLDYITIYSVFELVNMFLPDLPELPKSVTSKDCSPHDEPVSCNLKGHIVDIHDSCVSTLTTLNKARTSFGLDELELNSIPISPDQVLDVPEKPLRVEMPGDEIIRAAGRNWFEDVRKRVEKRRFANNGSLENDPIIKESLKNGRPPRFIQTLVQASSVLSSVIPKAEILNFFQSLFVSENSILRFLTNLKVFNPLTSFVDVSNRVSEFEQKTRENVGELLEDNRNIKSLTNKLEEDINNHQMNIALLQEGYINTQQLLADGASTLFNSIVYFSYYSSFAECRAGFLSNLFLPPHLLGEKLAAVEQALDTNMRLSIKPEEIQKYYVTEGLASCAYDSFGGLLTLRVPILPKASDFKLFEVTSLNFAWKQKTCTLAASSQFVLKDVAQNKILSIEDKDMGLCDVHKTRMCQIPKSGGDDSHGYCLTALMVGSTMSEVKEACPMRCVDQARETLSQISPTEFVGVHLETGSVVIQCDNHENVTITEKVEYGSHRITLQCSCRLFLRNRLIAQSGGSKCAGTGNEGVVVEALLPPHFSSLSDYIPFAGSGMNDITRFKSKEEVFNPHFMQGKENESSVFTSHISYWSLFWQSLHSIAIAFILFKMNLLNLARITGVAYHVGRANAASSQPYCKLDDGIYNILYVLIFLTSLAYIPTLIERLYKFFKGLFLSYVEVYAEKRVVEAL